MEVKNKFNIDDDVFIYWGGSITKAKVYAIDIHVSKDYINEKWQVVHSFNYKVKDEYGHVECYLEPSLFSNLEDILDIIRKEYSKQ